MPPRSGADAGPVLETVAGFEDPDEPQLDLTRKSCKANLNSRILGFILRFSPEIRAENLLR